MGEDSDAAESWDSATDASTMQCDAILVSSDGIPFNAHKRLLCDASELFEAFFAERWTTPDGTRTKYESKNIDSHILQIILDDIYGKEPEVPIDLLLPVLQAAEFLLLKSQRLRDYCNTVIVREPFAVLNHEQFYPEIVNNSALVDSILKADLLMTNESQLRKLMFSWPSDDAGLVHNAKNRLKALSRKIRDVAYFYDRTSQKFFGFTGNRCFQWYEREYLSFPEDVQHMAISNTAVLYSTSTEVRDCCSSRALYTEQADFQWPPLLRRYGNKTVWSEANRRKLRIRNSEPRKKDAIVTFDTRATIVRHIASVGPYAHDRLIAVVTQDGIWKLLMFDDINKYQWTENSEDLECPLKRIDAVAVLNDTIYVLGNETMNNASDRLLVYEERDRQWTFLQDRQCGDEVRAFFPLNGRLYVACNDRDTCEVYEPSIDKWMVTEFYRMNDIASCSITSRGDF